MTTKTLPFDFESLRQADSSPAELTLVAPDGEGEIPQLVRAFFEELTPSRDTDPPAQIRVTAVALDRPDGRLVVSGRARTALSAGRDVGVKASYAAGGTLVELAITPDPPDDGEAVLTLGGPSGLSIRVQQALYRLTSKDAQATSRLLGSISVGGAQVHVGATLTGDGSWVVDAIRSEDGARWIRGEAAPGGSGVGLTLEKLILVRKDELAPLGDFLGATLGSVGGSVDGLQIGVDGGSIVLYRVKVGAASASKPWVLVENTLAIEQVALDLAVRRPLGAPGWRFTGILDGDVRVNDATVQFRLTNIGARWRLTPRESITLDLAGMARWIGAESFANWLPAWAKSEGGTKVETLALELDLTQSGAAQVALLEAVVVMREEIEIPGLKRARIREVSFGLALKCPFDAKAREATIALRGLAVVQFGETDSTRKEFELSGWVASSGRWALSAGSADDLSLTDALQSMAGLALDDRALSLFGDFDLSLCAPNIVVHSDGVVTFRSDLLIQKKAIAGDKRFNLGGGKLEFMPGGIEIVRSGSHGSYALHAGMTLELSGGPKIDECVLWIRHESEPAAGVTSVTLTSQLTFPREPPHRPIRVRLLGEYHGGDNGGFSFSGSVFDVPVNPLINGMIGLVGARLPDDFPDLTVESAIVSFDTATGAYEAGGSVKATELKLGDTTISDAALRLAVKTSCKGDKQAETSVSFEGSAKVNGFEISLTIDRRGASTEVVARFKNELSLSEFAKTFPDAASPPASTDDDFKLRGLGFHYKSITPAADASRENGEKAPPGSTLSFFLDWGGIGKLDLALVRKTAAAKDRIQPLFLIRPSVSWLGDGSVVAWAASELHDVPLFPESARESRIWSFEKGFFARATVNLEGTGVGRSLGTSDSIEVIVKRGDLSVVVTNKSPKKKLEALPPATTPAQGASTEPTPALSKEPAAPEKPAEEMAGAKTFRIEKTLALGTVINALAPAKDGAKPEGTWGQYVGDAVVVSNLGVTLRSRPKPGVTVFADIGLNVGPWGSIAVKGFAVALTPASLSLQDVTKNLKTDFDLDGAALSINIQPFIKGAAAVIRDRSDASGLAIVGVGELQILKKIKVDALAYIRWKREDDRYNLDEGFGFVCATGLNIPLPPIVLTGIAGGFGYCAVPKLPGRAEDVPSNPLLQLLRGESSDRDSTAAGMLARLDTFKTSMQRQQDSWCLVFGLTFTLAKMVDCAALVVVESRKTGLEIALLGVADFTVGAKPGSGGRTLAQVQLSLLARWSASAGSVIVLGAVTGDSWVLDKECKIQGGFAICYWYRGEHAGDFLVSIGGYSPFVPKRAHYPTLDRVAFKWQVDEDLSMYGSTYLTLDRYSLQLGCAAGLSYRTSRVSLEACFSFDALLEWAPLYYEARLRISVHVEIRVVITLRLGLDVDVHLWGPPFGAKIHVEVQLWPYNPSFTVSIGSTREEAQNARNALTLGDVIDLAAGGKDLSTLKFISGQNPAKLVDKSVTPTLRAHRFESERPCTVDDLKITVETAIPLTAVYLGSRASPSLGAGAELVLDVRARDWKKVTSELLVSIEQLIARRDKKPGEDPYERRPVDVAWTVTPERSSPLESLWCIPEDKDRPWALAKRELITAVHVTPRESNAGARFDGVRLTKETSPHPTAAQTSARLSASPRTAAPGGVVAAALGKDRGALLDAIKKAGFEPGTCSTKGYHPIDVGLLTAERATRKGGS